MKIAFDIDDTILVPSVVSASGDNVPNYEVIAVYRFFQAQGHEMILWSGSGIDWAKRWGEKFGLEPFIVRVKEKSEDVELLTAPEQKIARPRQIYTGAARRDVPAERRALVTAGGS